MRARSARGSPVFILFVAVLLVCLTAPDLKRRAHVYFFGNPAGLGTVQETKVGSKGMKTVLISVDDREVEESLFFGPTYRAGSRLKISAAGNDLAWAHPAPLLQSAGLVLMFVSLFFLALPAVLLGRRLNKELPKEAALLNLLKVSLFLALLLSFGGIFAYPR